MPSILGIWGNDGTLYYGCECENYPQVHWYTWYTTNLITTHHYPTHAQFCTTKKVKWEKNMPNTPKLRRLGVRADSPTTSGDWWSSPWLSSSDIGLINRHQLFQGWLYVKEFYDRIFSLAEISKVSIKAGNVHFPKHSNPSSLPLISNRDSQ